MIQDQCVLDDFMIFGEHLNRLKCLKDWIARWIHPV